jgi:DNA-binding MarR family transcriptional regulator
LRKQTISQAELAELIALLPAITKAMSRAYTLADSIKDEWRRHGLAPRHMKVLALLALTGPMSVSEISARLEVGLATASLLVGELGRVGLVVRREDENDRRRTIAELAPTHRAAVTGVFSRRAAVIRAALEMLEPTEQAALIKGLRAIMTALETTAIEEPQLARQRR